MKKYTLTKFDHEKNCVTIGRKSNKLVLKGVTGEGKLNTIYGNTMNKILKKGQTLIAHLFVMRVSYDKVQEPVDETTERVLDHYPDVFIEPTTLSPVRSLDHLIPLKQGMYPISLRPYRYK